MTLLRESGTISRPATGSAPGPSEGPGAEVDRRLLVVVRVVVAPGLRQGGHERRRVEGAEPAREVVSGAGCEARNVEGLTVAVREGPDIVVALRDVDDAAPAAVVVAAVASVAQPVEGLVEPAEGPAGRLVGHRHDAGELGRRSARAAEDMERRTRA